MVEVTVAREPLVAERARRRERDRARADLDRLTGVRRRSAIRGWFGVAVTVVVVIAVAAGVTVGWRVHHQNYSDSDYRGFAAEAVGLLLTPDARDGARAQRILSMSTGTFRDEFAQSAGAYGAFVARLGTVADGTVDGVAIADRDGDAVTALITAVVITRAGSNASDPRRFRIRSVIRPDDGALRLADIEFLP